MFKIFKKKRSGDIVDLTLLEKKGFFKEKTPLPTRFDKGDNLSDNQTLPPPVPVTSTDIPQSSASLDSTDMGFFSAIASSAEPSRSPGDTGVHNDQNVLENQNGERVNKIEDRVEHILDRIYKILQRIEILERKIERLERRSGFGKLETY